MSRRRAARYGAGMTEAAAATMWLLVGLPAAGKTTRARALADERDALRLTPDDWLLALQWAVEVDDAVRDALEGRLLDLAIPALRGGVDVVVDFGLWGRDERTALRWMAAQLGARAVVEHLDVDETEQLARVRARAEDDARLHIPAEDTRAWRAQFEAPGADELAGGPLDPVPEDVGSWGEWAATRWPGLRVVTAEEASRPRC